MTSRISMHNHITDSGMVHYFYKMTVISRLLQNSNNSVFKMNHF